MPRLPPLPSVRELVRLYGLQAKQQLSQNFLFDLNLCKKFARQLAAATDEALVTTAGELGRSSMPPVVLEVGPGPGGLTRTVLGLGGGSKALVAVEKDPRFVPALAMLLQHAADASLPPGTEAAREGILLQGGGAGRLCDTAKVVQDDVLRVDEHELLKGLAQELPMDHEEGACEVGVLGNLPFAVATELLLKWTAQVASGTGIGKFGRVPMVLSFQTEVADRIFATPNSRKYGRLSVMTQQWLQPELSFTIAAQNFVPPPKVNATVLRIVPRRQPLSPEPITFHELEYLTRELFSQRRKVVSNVLASFVPAGGSNAALELLKKAKIDGRKRPEHLGVEEFCSLTRHFMDAFRDKVSLPRV
mmetsp:Transcript_8593/g.35816  ORF Transcript_8593/g.35816 Transcript_8593/m.35816 type:complete len:361 (+) Transcript_8593:45-1127(+)